MMESRSNSEIEQPIFSAQETAFNTLLAVARQCGDDDTSEQNKHLDRLLTLGYSLHLKHPQTQLTIIQMLAQEGNQTAIFSVCRRGVSVLDAIEIAFARDNTTLADDLALKV